MFESTTTTIIVYACPYDGSKNAFTVLVFHAVVDSNFSTTDYCMSLRLQQLGFHCCNLRQEKYFSTTPVLQLCSVEETQAGMRSTAIIPSLRPTPAANNQYPEVGTIHGASGVCMRCMRCYGSV